VKQIDPKKSTIRKVTFNQYGDKLYSMNLEGNVAIFKFDTNESSKTVPIYQLKKAKEDKVNDFDIINSDTVIAVTA
jgi:hypothetical protein